MLAQVIESDRATNDGGASICRTSTKGYRIGVSVIAGGFEVLFDPGGLLTAASRLAAGQDPAK